ncbi:hypothetical protein VTK73DRAFT_7857 [Phialemonium thermophilum]|uniref:Uncharacterized protein n=1 Tax=Phialemonium thermophilum TaxID=223376 RepID=A0ABR3WC18_9PEZI
MGGLYLSAVRNPHVKDPALQNELADWSSAAIANRILQSWAKSASTCSGPTQVSSRSASFPHRQVFAKHTMTKKLVMKEQNQIPYSREVHTSFRAFTREVIASFVRAICVAFRRHISGLTSLSAPKSSPDTASSCSLPAAAISLRLTVWRCCHLKESKADFTHQVCCS